MVFVKREYTVRFTTPAFLGDAQQRAQWRTPPFKHLLRAWWRIAYAMKREFAVDLNHMRREEGRLFGAAASSSDSSKSLVRLRLSSWKSGSMKAWPRKDPRVKHPDVHGGNLPVGSHLYLGYGPLEFVKHNGTQLKNKPAIGTDERQVLHLAFPEADAPMLDQALSWCHLFGSVGGRCRNGWGSLSLEGREGSPDMNVALPLRQWMACFLEDEEWPHAIGHDAVGPLIWVTRPHADWQSLMETLARLKIGLRTQFPFKGGNYVPVAEDRHWLAYPVTNHSVRGWGSYRLPNTLRFKVRQCEGRKVVGVIVHIPHAPPEKTRSDKDRIKMIRVWQKVHNFLDLEESLERSQR